MRRTRVGLLGLGLALAVLAGCYTGPEVAVGKTAPAYEARDLDGTPVSLASLRGEVVLLNVWATWCYPCRREMPSFEALHRDFEEEGLRVVAVSIDRAGAETEVRDFLEEHGITFSILHDSEQQIAKTFSTIGVPETYLIGRDGTLLRHWMGRIDGHSESVRGPVREALAGRRLASH